MSLCALAVALVVTPLQAADEVSGSLDKIREEVASGKAVLVDVRELKEWNAGHVKGAIFVPLSKNQSGLTDQAKQSLPKDKQLYTYCVKGIRASTAADLLEKQGYQVKSLQPGYTQLIQAGFASETAENK